MKVCVICWSQTVVHLDGQRSSWSSLHHLECGLLFRATSFAYPLKRKRAILEILGNEKPFVDCGNKCPAFSVTLQLVCVVLQRFVFFRT